MIATLLLAAGASSRMRGGDKLLELVGGQALLRLMVERALAAELGPVLVALPAPDHPRAAVLRGLDCRCVIVAHAAEGMGASIRAGICALPRDADAVMILPADMPEVTTQDLKTLVGGFDGHSILRGSAGKQAGHPVLFPKDLFGALELLSGDQGARPVIAANRDRLRLVPLPRQHATTDLDSPEAWSAWRASHPS